jgi:hypothetical protein
LRENPSTRIPEKKVVIQEQEENVLLTEDHLVAIREKDFQEGARRVTVRMKKSLSKEDPSARIEEEAKRNRLKEDHQAMIEEQEQQEADRKATVLLKENRSAVIESLSEKTRERDVHTAMTESREDHLTGHSRTVRTRRSLFVLMREEVATDGLQTAVQIQVRTVTGLQRSM